jgi:hypothetical protein
MIHQDLTEKMIRMCTLTLLQINAYVDMRAGSHPTDTKTVQMQKVTRSGADEPRLLETGREPIEGVDILQFSQQSEPSISLIVGSCVLEI